MDKQELQNKIEELEERLRNQESQIINLNNELFTVRKQLVDDKITRDGTVLFTGGIDVLGGKPLFIGNGGLTEVTTSIDQSSEINSVAIASGRDRGSPASGVKQSSNNSQIFLQHQNGTTGGTNQTFLFGYRPPLYQNYTDTSGITATNWNNYRIVYTYGTNVKFYINNTLVATHTTNRPTSSNNARFGIGAASSSKSAELANVVISVEQ